MILNYTQTLSKLKNELDNADTILIGAGAGLSTSAGFTYDGKRFTDNFSDMIERYGFTDMFSAGFYPFQTPEEKWAYWSRFVYINRYEPAVGKVYKDLLSLVQGKNFFVITTNVDHQFQKAGFPKERLFYTQGDYGLFQCSKPCHKKTYENEQTIRRMVAEQKNGKISSELIPYCPVCGEPMSMNLRADDTFVEDGGWQKASGRYANFVKQNMNKRIIYLELGVGGNTPGIIKYPFWRYTFSNPKALYVCINKNEAAAPKEIIKQSICFQNDISDVLSKLKPALKQEVIEV
jgi:NAD-dependent SIR2 family protein deacetylase